MRECTDWFEPSLLENDILLLFLFSDESCLIKVIMTTPDDLLL